MLEKRLRKEYYKRKPKGFWFNSSTMKYFDSIVDSKNYFEKDKKIYFITSEKRNNSNRKWSIRVFEISS